MTGADIHEIVWSVVGAIIVLGFVRIILGIPMPWDRVSHDD